MTSSDEVKAVSLVRSLFLGFLAMRVVLDVLFVATRIL